ncbi:MAG: HEAT repeat domain-containing protein [Terriglobia bacterium]
MINDTGRVLNVKSNFSSAFDGFQLIVFRSDGSRLARESYVSWQSPCSDDRLFPVNVGENRKLLDFLVSALPDDVDKVGVLPVGTLPGTDYWTILCSDMVTIPIKGKREGWQEHQTAASEPPQPPLVTGAAGKPDERSETRVRQWLAKNSYAGLWDHHHNYPSMDWDDWTTEGRGIPDVEPVLRTLLAKRDKNVELPLVANALGRLGKSASVPGLIDCLTSEDFHLRMNAAIALGNLRDARAIQPLWKRFGVEPDVNVRANIVQALADLGGPDAAKYLKTAANDGNPFVSKVAKRALAGNGLEKPARAAPGHEGIPPK